MRRRVQGGRRGKENRPTLSQHRKKTIELAAAEVEARKKMTTRRGGG